MLSIPDPVEVVVGFGLCHLTAVDGGVKPGSSMSSSNVDDGGIELDRPFGGS